MSIDYIFALAGDPMKRRTFRGAQRTVGGSCPRWRAAVGRGGSACRRTGANISWIESPLGRLHCNGHRCMVLWGSLSYAVHVFLRILHGNITFHSVQVCVCAFIEAFMLFSDCLGCVRASVCAICFNFCCFWASGAKHGETKNPYCHRWFCLVNTSKL